MIEKHPLDIVAGHLEASDLSFTRADETLTSDEAHVDRGRAKKRAVKKVPSVFCIDNELGK